MNINLHIERLVLDGISVASNQQLELKTSTIEELVRLLTINGIGSGMWSGTSIRAIRGGTISIGENGESAELGQQIASAVNRGMSK